MFLIVYCALYPSIHTRLVLSSVTGSAGAYPSSLWAKGRDTPWTDQLSIAGLHVDEQTCTLTITVSNPYKSMLIFNDKIKKYRPKCCKYLVPGEYLLAFSQYSDENLQHPKDVLT